MKPVCVRGPVKHPKINQILRGLTRLGVTIAYVYDRALAGSVVLNEREKDSAWIPPCCIVVILDLDTKSDIPIDWVVLRIFFRFVCDTTEDRESITASGASHEAYS